MDRKLTRLETADQILAALFSQASKPRQVESLERAIREALLKNGVPLHTEMESLLAGSMIEKQIAELGPTCRRLSDEVDSLYFDQEETGEPESVCGKSFQKSRAYAAMAELCEERWDEALYEALLSLDSNGEMIASLAGYLNP